MSRFMGITAVLVLGCARWCMGAEGPPLTPADAPPDFGSAAVRDNGEMELTYQVFKPVYETRTKQVPYQMAKTVNGQTVYETHVKTVTYTATTYVCEQRVRPLPAAEFQVTRDDKRLDKDAAADALKQRIPVVIHKTKRLGQELDAFYRQFLKPGVLVVSIQQNEPAPLSPMPGGVAPPAPVPVLWALGPGSVPAPRPAA